VSGRTANKRQSFRFSGPKITKKILATRIDPWRLLMHSGRYLYSSAELFPCKKQRFGLEKNYLIFKMLLAIFQEKLAIFASTGNCFRPCRFVNMSEICDR